ncbi:LamG domain-containing protein, partial [Candidatus Woesearchaeota archaeon]|nr:LamG domain-containing protein [Candidatus Woesearchaeota archaeon]
ISCLLLIGVISFLGYYGITGLATFKDETQTNFSSGTHANTFFNTTDGKVMLNTSLGLNGTFTSQVFDAGPSATWNNISWVSNSGEMPSNQVVTPTINMTGNVLLIHLNNDSAYGENTTFFYDYSGNNNNGTCTGTTCPTFNGSSKILGNYSMDFGRSSSQMISIANSKTLNINTNTMAFSAWINPSLPITEAVGGGVFGKSLANDGAYRVFHSATADDFRFRLFTGNPTGTATNCDTDGVKYTAGTWHHLAGTYDGVNMRVYWDGLLNVTCAKTGTVTNTTEALTLGQFQASQYWEGVLDEIAIWNRNLSVSEIEDLYRRGLIRLNLSVRSCDDSACSGETFTNLKTPMTPINFSVSNNQYFQYSFDFGTSGASYSPMLYNVTVDYTAFGTEANNPNVTNLLPAANTIFNASNIIEIAANTSDQSKITSVSASVMYPNGTAVQYTLLNDTTHADKWNTSFNSTLSGNYSIIFTATDKWANINGSTSTVFDIDYNFTFINSIAYGWANGTRNNLFYNGTSTHLRLNNLRNNASFLSQIFDVSASQTWNNISWKHSALGELPSNQKNEISSNDYASGNINMTGNVLLFHFNNDTSVGENKSHVYDHSGQGNNGTWNGSGIRNGDPRLGAFSGEFDGGDYIDLNPSNRLSDTNVVIALWVKPDDIITNRYVTGGASGATANKRALIIGYQDNNFNIFNNGVYPTGTAADTQIPATQDQWQHIIYASDGSRVYGYKNGVLLVDVSANLNVDDGNMTDYNIGSTSAGGANFNGSIDEFAIWNRSLSATEIKNIYLRGATRLNLSVRSCNDAACSGESFTDINDTSPQYLSNYSISDNRWFQYNVSFETFNETVTPELYNVTINHTSAVAAGDSTKPLVNTTIPSVNSVYNITNTIEIGVNATDETAMSRVFANVTYPNGTIYQLTLSNKTNFDNKYNTSITLDLLTGLYNITYIANDSSNNINSSTTSNFTVKVGCATIASSGTITMDQNVASTGTCFTITSSNVNLNCAGNLINYSTDATLGYGITINTGLNQVNISHCNITEGNINTNSKNSINVGPGLSASTFYNNTIRTIGNGSQGIAGTGLSTMNISTNTITATGDNTVGIVFLGGGTNNIERNTIRLTGNDSDNSGDDNFALILFSNTASTSNSNTLESSGKTGGVIILQDTNSSNSSNDVIQNSPVGMTLYTAFSNIINGLQLNNVTDTGLLIIGSNSNTLNNTLVNTSIDSGSDGTNIIQDSNNNIIQNSNFYAPTVNLVILGISNGPSGNIIKDNNFNSATIGIDIINSGATVRNNTYLNNNFTGAIGGIITDNDISGNDTLVYNNSFGEVIWTNFTFRNNLTFKTNNGNFVFGNEIYIGNNTMAFNTSHISDGFINSSANITLAGIGLSAVNRIMKVSNYTTSSADIQVHGSDCIAAGTCWKLSYSGGTLVFNTTGFSSFSANESTGVNTLPTSPILLLLANNSYTTNRTPSFTWNNSTDPDGDALMYNLVIDDNSAFNNPEVNVTKINPTSGQNTTYAITTELNVDTTYYWKVAANDSNGYGSWSNTSNFTVQSYLLITLTTNSVAFGSMAINDKNDTTDNAPPPFTAINNGNIIANVTITATSYFSSASFPGNAYQFKIRANESSSFDTANSNLSFINMSSSYTGYHVRGLNWQDVNDDFLVDLNVTVPSSEPPGAKSSTVTFTMEGG